MKLPQPRAILFDLDGTLADTAPDLAGAVNQMRLARGLSPTPYENLRPVASSGARGLLAAAFGITPEAPEYEAMRIDFLNRYETGLVIDSRLFDGVADLLVQLEQRGLAWGIVTNKAARFTDPLAPLLGLGHAGCIISGDTTPHSKPHPAPLLEAAARLQLAPQECWYVGDDLRDIQAGRAAGMPTIAAAWGYCGDAAPTTWGADELIHTPLQLLDLLRS
ncbi:HAD-IA family hydrolase [Herbaspirillum sp. RTI4]|uniref:HAD family hydrolase n=1 Tax=Herbaspirillum sp. RTI4 TaxID=3048640 RepID=UPI002AB39A9D|nr:HAD-IA family hydrolase [Herbaspirillum sp. RTI4]MDY7579910.1 HAD-IA family hydrolase [Herbaspirillum sp. RTI4]MEA9983345.1 HAD-IA family hydrolase [Herbaspirillum sp. RTI4]